MRRSRTAIAISRQRSRKNQSFFGALRTSKKPRLQPPSQTPKPLQSLQVIAMQINCEQCVCIAVTLLFHLQLQGIWNPSFYFSKKTVRGASLLNLCNTFKLNMLRVLFCNSKKRSNASTHKYGEISKDGTPIASSRSWQKGDQNWKYTLNSGSGDK